MVTPINPADPPIPGRSDPGQEPERDWAGMVAGLAREVEELRRTLGPLEGVPARVEELAGVVVRLADATARPSSGSDGDVPVASWLDLPRDVREARTVLADLTRWLRTVYLRYTDAAQGFPECWLWHPDVVEELLWLWQSWGEAYQVDGAPLNKAADWHDRLRPGVVRRTRSYVGTCSLESHIRDQSHRPPHGGGPVVPVADAADLIAQWWGAHRDTAAPEPTDAQVAAAAAAAREHKRRNRP